MDNPEFTRNRNANSGAISDAEDNHSERSSWSEHTEGGRKKSSSSTSTSHKDGDSVDSFEHQRVYTNPTFDEAPEIPEIDYMSSRRTSVTSRSTESHQSGLPPTRRPSNESVIVRDSADEQPDPRFYTIPLQSEPPVPDSATVVSTESESADNFRKMVIYGIIIFAIVAIIILVVVLSVYYTT